MDGALDYYTSKWPHTHTASLNDFISPISPGEEEYKRGEEAERESTSREGIFPTSVPFLIFYFLVGLNLYSQHIHIHQSLCQPVVQFGCLSTYSPACWPVCLSLCVLSIHVGERERQTHEVARFISVVKWNILRVFHMANYIFLLLYVCVCVSEVMAVGNEQHLGGYKSQGEHWAEGDTWNQIHKHIHTHSWMYWTSQAIPKSVMHTAQVCKHTHTCTELHRQTHALKYTGNEI